MKSFVLKSLRYTKENRWLFVTIIIVAVVIALYTISPFKLVKVDSKDTNLIIINDKRCKECDTTYLESSLKQIFPNLNIKELDYSSKKGKQLYKELKLQYLPAALFDDTVESGAGYNSVKTYLIPTGDYQLLQIGASFNPSKEICDNGKDDTGNGKIDCQDEDCKGSLLCRSEIKNNLQVFIMSDCPYGRKAIEALKEVVDNFGNIITYEVHYIANEATGQFQSLHGQYEVDENIIQLCVKKHSSEQWLNYIYCRSTKGVKGIDWKNCAKETGINIAKVESCFNNEGKDLLRQDIKIADSLGVSGSPTWLANNRYSFGGIDAETIKENFCKYNENLKACETTLSSSGGVPTGQC